MNLGMEKSAGESTTMTRDNRFPAGIPFIVGNEGAERFSYYGMRQILYIYLTALFIGFVAEGSVDPGLLSHAKIKATQWTHLFMAGVYLFPMIGAILADRLLGKYRVIFWVSLIYVAGHATLAIGGRFASLHNLAGAEYAIILGLGLVAIGSGGIKPCVSANVGDQFTAKNSHLVGKVFQIFYFIINFGSFFCQHPDSLVLQTLRSGGCLRSAGYPDGARRPGVLARPQTFHQSPTQSRWKAGTYRLFRIHTSCRATLTGCVCRA